MQMNLQNQQPVQGIEHNQVLIDERSKQGLFGFKARMFPLLGAIIASISILLTYHVARSKNPPDVPPFPQTDITHCAIHYPEYVIFRIGMMVTPVLFCISFQILKNYLMIKSFQILGQEQTRVKNFGTLSIISCLCLCLSTSTISDGGDMDWTSHTIGATSFFILAMYMCIVASKVYRDLYFYKPGFCSKWSYLIKKYAVLMVIIFLTLTLLDALKIIDIGSLVEWLATFYIMLYFLTLYDDFKDMDIMMQRKRADSNIYQLSQC